ncbi:MAG: hypothetical protein EBX52_12820 [Proteobacteria bacterium]|nr:hypothetical protein [Pseudomonadota bacterium]
MLLTLTLNPLPALAAAHSSYSMGGWEVVIRPGDVERKPQISHKTHEMDTERSSPTEDPSPRTGYHFALKEFQKQSAIGGGMAASKFNPFSSRGFIYGNLEKSRNESVHRGFTSRDSLVPLLRARQSLYLYGNLNPENGPALVNSDYEYDGISDRAFGFCWGFSTMNRFFAYLAFYDPSIAPPARYIAGATTQNERWFRYYEGIIDDIMDGKPRVIPGFRNFAEFSSVPEIEFYLKLKNTEAWAQRAISRSTVSTFFTSTRELDSPQIDALVARLKRRLNRGELPKILFTAADSRKQMGGTLDVHSVLVNGVRLEKDGTGEIDVWDINFYFSDLIRERKILEIRKNASTGRRELHYRPWYEKKSTPEATYRSSLLGQVRISPDDAGEMGRILENLREFCDSSASTSRYCRTQ